ncbi:MAG TPA: universal stress protein [Polyangiaceae bacterium]
MAKAKTQRKSSDKASASTRAGFHSLLVPIDFTPISDRVLSRLSLLPLADGARVTLLHVVPESLPAREQRNAEQDASKALAEEAKHLRTLLPRQVRIEPWVKRGSAVREIAAAATRLNTDLIVMGRAGRRALRDAFIGSTAERVIRQARLPVLAVRLAARAAYRRPALALDLDPTAHDVVRLMLAVLPTPLPWVEVIHAIDFPYGRVSYPSLPEDQVQRLKSELRSNATRQLEKLLATALAKASVRAREQPFWKTHVQCGSPRIVVEKLVKKMDTDLLVLGTRAYSGAAYVLLGTVAGDLLRAARCDVLIVPPSRPHA